MDLIEYKNWHIRTDRYFQKQNKEAFYLKMRKTLITCNLKYYWLQPVLYCETKVFAENNFAHYAHNYDVCNNIKLTNPILVKIFFLQN